MARPIPDEEPVTIATLSLRRPDDVVVELAMVGSKSETFLVYYQSETILQSENEV